MSWKKLNDRYSSPHGCVHTPRLSGKPKCAFNGDKLVDSVSDGRAIFGTIHDRDEENNVDDINQKLNDRYSSPYGCVHTPRLSGKPKCAFNGDKLVDSVSAGRVVCEIVGDRKEENNEEVIKHKTLTKVKK